VSERPIRPMPEQFDQHGIPSVADEMARTAAALTESGYSADVVAAQMAADEATIQRLSGPAGEDPR
jgi:hypothetical protein